MQNRPLITAIIATQLIFALACTGGSSESSSRAGDEVQLDETPAPLPDEERPDLVDDGRCDWLGAPFASSITDTVFVLRSTDRHDDCSGGNIADSKLIYRVSGSTRHAILDVTDLDDVRMVEAGSGAIVFSNNSSGGESLWRVDPSSGAVLATNDQPGTYSYADASPDGRWIAVDTQMSSSEMVQLINPDTLTAHALTADGVRAAWTWLDSGTLATVEYNVESTRLALWDLFGDTVPSAPLFEVEVPDFGTPLVSEAALVASPDGRTLAFHGWRGEQKVAVFDRDSGEVRVIEQVSGPVAFSPNGRIIGHYEGLLRVIDPATLHMASVEVGSWPEFVVSTRTKHAVVGGYNLDHMLHVDLDTLETVQIDRALTSNSQRGDALWMADAEGLLRLDLESAETTLVEGAASKHVVWMPAADKIFVDERGAPTVHFVDPVSLTVLDSVDLSGDFGTAPTVLERR